MISAASMATTSNPVVVYGLLIQLKKINETNNLTVSQTWNCNKTVLLHMPHSVKPLLQRINNQGNLQVVQEETTYEYLQPTVLVGKL